MLDKNLLLVDIGGTNIRYAYSNIGDLSFVSENKAELESLNDFDNLISELLANSVVKNIVFSVAGPKVNNSIKMTNRNFEIDADAIKKRFNLESCHLLNDWESIGYSIKTFSENDFDDFKEGIPFNDNFLVIGPGTGLGASVIYGNNVVATEIGNTNLGLSALKSLLKINSDEFNVLEHIYDGRVHAGPKFNDPRPKIDSFGRPISTYQTERAHLWCWPSILRAKNVATVRGNIEIAHIKIDS